MPNTELLIYLADSDLDIDTSPYYFVSENVAIGPIVKQNGKPSIVVTPSPDNFTLNSTN